MAKRSRTEYSIMNIFASVGGYTLNIIMSFICRIVFARCLNAEYLGLNGIFVNILSMLSLTELGIGTAMIYALYKPVAQNDKEKISSYMKVYGVAYKTVGIMVALLGIAFIPFLNIVINEPPNIKENIYFLYLLFLFSTASSYFYSYRSSILVANQRNYVVLSVSYFLVIVQNMLQIITLITTRNYILYLIIQVVSVLITNLLISQKAIKDYPYIKDKNAPSLEKSEIKDLFKNIKALTITKLSGILVNNTDNLVITYFNGLITTGLVSNYLLITNTLTSLVNQIFSGLSASIGNLNAIGEEKQKYVVFKALNLINFWIYGWISIGIIVLSNDIVELCFGKDYVMNVYVSIVLALNFYMSGMLYVVSMYKSTMGLFRYGQYVLIFTAVLNLIGDIVLGQILGIIGIFIATALARLLTNVWYEPFVVYKYGFDKNFKEYILRYFIYFILLIVVSSLCYILGELMCMSLISNILFKIIICILVPNSIFYLVFSKCDEFEYIRNIAKRLLLKFQK